MCTLIYFYKDDDDDVNNSDDKMYKTWNDSVLNNIVLQGVIES